MILISQPEQEGCSADHKNLSLDEGDYVFHGARFYKHLEKAGAFLERQRSAPPHLKRVFRQIQAGLLLATESIKHATHRHRGARHG
jgi:hypothetical protein